MSLKFTFLKLILLPILIPISILYALISFVRNLLYDFKFFKALDAPRPVVSIGNITAGGTGKTPFTAYLMEYFFADKKVGLVSRGYGRKHENSKILEVQKDSLATEVGDEPLWYKQKFHDLNIVVGSDRLAAADLLVQMHPETQVLLADDAFQHRRLKRDLDIVILDASVSCLDYLPIPLGRGREDFVFGILRADILVINKINDASFLSYHLIRSLIDLIKREECVIVEFSNEIECLYKLGESENTISAEQLNSQNGFMICGIARPFLFKKCLDRIKLNIKENYILKDHQQIEGKLLKQIQTVILKSNPDYIVITEKDATKFEATMFNKPVYVAKLKLNSQSPLEPMYEILSRKFR